MICYMYFTQCSKNPAKLIKCIECASRVECVEGVLLKMNRLGCCKLAVSKTCPGAAGGCIPAAWSCQQTSSVPPGSPGEDLPWLKGALEPSQSPLAGAELLHARKTEQDGPRGPSPTSVLPTTAIGRPEQGCPTSKISIKIEPTRKQRGRLGDSV